MGKRWYIALALLAAACAGRQKTPGMPPPEPPTAEWVRDDKVIPLLSPEQANPLVYATQAQASFNDIARKVQRCYKKELRQRPRLHGELVVGLTVGATGAVEKAWVDFSTVPSLQLEACLMPLFQGMELPPPAAGSVELHHPYVFTSKDTPPEIAQALRRLHKLEDPDKWDETYGKPSEQDEFDAPW